MKKFIFPAALVVVVLAVIFSLSIGDRAPETAATSDAAVASTESASPEVEIAIQSVETNTNLASPAGARSKMVSWEARNYPSNIGVDINLLRKVSDSPTSYAFVRKIVSNTANDGSELWTPNSGETGSDLYIEVTCASGQSFTGGCQITSQPIKAN
jgi:hypothetical protein